MLVIPRNNNQLLLIQEVVSSPSHVTNAQAATQIILIRLLIWATVKLPNTSHAYFIIY